MKHEDFLQLYNGTLSGIIKEDGYLDLLDSLTGEWYTLEFSREEIKLNIKSAAELKKIMAELFTKVKNKGMTSVTYPYTYVANRESPKMIKIYDPSNCGSSCSTTSPEPTWVFSIVEPNEDDLNILRPQKKKGFFSKLLNK